jgi:hypothetical protein
MTGVKQETLASAAALGTVMMISFCPPVVRIIQVPQGPELNFYVHAYAS